MKWMLLAVLFSAPAMAQEAPNAILLIAKPSLLDPNFRETVVLVTQTAETLYSGGPVMREVIVALFRAEQLSAVRRFFRLGGGAAAGRAAA